MSFSDFVRDVYALICLFYGVLAVIYFSVEEKWFIGKLIMRLFKRKD